MNAGKQRGVGVCEIKIELDIPEVAGGFFIVSSL